MNSVLKCIAVSCFVCAMCAADPAAPAFQFNAGAAPDADTLVLLNADAMRPVERAGRSTLQMPAESDPYHRSTWDFRCASALPADWTSLVVEIEYFDEGAGILQPQWLSDDTFDGAWAQPLRRVSFTRLNTLQERRALFQFDLPALDWPKTRHPHLSIAGMQFPRAIRIRPAADETEWRALAEAVPLEVIPLVRLQRPMHINCTVGIPDVGYPPSMETALENIREYAPLAKLLGFTSAECYVRWDMIEPREGEFDFSHYDRIVKEIQRRGLKWFPNLVATSALSLPAWYAETPENVPMACLEHHDTCDVPSIWNDANRAHVTRVLQAIGDHYGPMGVLEAVRLGPSGNFGEAQYPAGAGSSLGYRGRAMHAHIGWWAGDALAAQDFCRFLQQRYTTIDALNAAWDEHYTDFEEIFPQLPETCRTRRGRLDMTEWYTSSMTQWCEFWAQQARAALPDVPIYQSSGGWGFRETGTDFSAQSASMKKYGGGIRLTNETDSFEQNFYATRLAATSARLFGIALGYEPAGYHSARGVAGRFFSTITTNGSNLYTRHNVLGEDPYSVDQWLREYPLLDLRANPVIDVAIYYPETMNQLDDGAFRHLYAWGFNPRAAEVRRRIDADFLDERLIREGFLGRYRVLVFCWGNIIEDDVQQHVDAWLRAGGTIIYPTYPRGSQETIDGNTTRFQAWEHGDTGQGTFHRFQSDMEPISLYGDFVEAILRNTPNLHPLTQQALQVKHPPHVFVSALETGQLVVLNYGETPAEVTLPNREAVVLAPFSTTNLPLPSRRDGS